MWCILHPSMKTLLIVNAKMCPKRYLKEKYKKNE